MSDTPAAEGAGHLRIEFLDEWHRADPAETFIIGREGDLAVDDNPYLHRNFLALSWDRLWWIANVGGTLGATVASGDGAVEAWLAPGGALPLVFSRTEVRFTAGPTTYALVVHLDQPHLDMSPLHRADGGETTVSPLALTDNQRLLVLALAEPSLRAGASRPSELPSSRAAAARLGWTITKFNRQLDSVCQKLTRGGVRGLHGDTSGLATNRRARLVEYALTARLVDVPDLGLLP